MFKTIMVSAAIFAAPAIAQSIKPIDALNGIIKMETASQFCGLRPNEAALIAMLDAVMPHVKKTPQEFADAIRRAAGELGTNYVNNGTIGVFCAEIGHLYGRNGG
jgi:hypothetical protein